MNKEEIIKEVISILDTSDYVDPAEHLYDGLKQIKREITYSTVHDFLWALESPTVIDVDGKVAECAKKIKPLLADMTIDEAYENYLQHYDDDYNEEQKKIQKNPLYWMEMKYTNIRPYPKEMFIDKCKTDTEFSERWGLKIDERELSLDERYKIALPIWKEKYGLLANMMVPTNVDNTPYKIPTKLITITYNDKTIESYE
jgi:hypothetical protein